MSIIKETRNRETIGRQKIQIAIKIERENNSKYNINQEKIN